MGTVKKIFDLKIYNGDNDLNKRWFVRVKVPDYKKGCLSWKKCYGDINKLHTIEERQKAAEELLQLIDLTQDYTTAQGSRIKGYVNENYHTDTVFQFKQQLVLRQSRVRKSTYSKYTGMIKNMELWLIGIGKKNLPVGAFTHNDARLFFNYLINKGHSNSSHNGHLRLFKGFFQELFNDSVVEKNPFNDIKGLPKQSTPCKYFQKKDILFLKGVISTRDPQLWLFVQFIYYCFLRPGELRHLKISDIQFHDEKISCRPEISKNKKHQYVSMPQVFYNELIRSGINKYDPSFYVFGKNGEPGEKQLGTNNMKIRHQAILKSLGFDIRYKLYSWKHTGAITCAKAGINLKDLQMQLRHHSLDQVNTYLNDMLVYESDFIKNSYPEL